MEQEVVAQPFAEGPLGGHAEKRYIKSRAREQAFWRGGGPADLAVHCLEARAQAAEDFIAQAFDFADGVALGDPRIDVDHGHKLPLRLLLATHEPFYPIRNSNTRFIFCFFTGLLKPLRPLAAPLSRVGMSLPTTVVKSVYDARARG